MNLLERAASLAAEARRNIALVIHGQEEAVELLLIALATRGHALLEGVPGVGKTTLAKTFAATAGLDFKRVQLTPDLMPTDITGHTFFNQAKGEFEVRRGPAFTNILLADEINRAPPRTQSALLEVMEERQVTIEGKSYPVPEPFLVVATKNPIDIEGVYQLPEAQLDRFMLFIRMRYPAESTEHDMLMGKLTARPPVPVTRDLVIVLHEATQTVRVHPDVVSYVLGIARATREHPDIELGAGPRAAEHLVAASRAAAALDGRAFVVPDDVKRVALPVLAHRLILAADAEVRGLSASDVLSTILARVPVPLEANRAHATN
ncbi:MAG: AAA family ATPase [Gemmatimonadota bacterium]